MPRTVLAAGAVLWRPVRDGIEICVVHRPRYDDWTLPKGKLHHGEHPLAAAVREVAEETGVGAHPQLRLPAVRYVLPDGAAKSVDFWLMRAAERPADDPQDPDEVDRVEWMPPAAAAARLAYAGDRGLVDHVAALPPVTAAVSLARHAYAGKRSEWQGDDALRPLDGTGQAQAAALAALLALFTPVGLYAGTPLRCRQTLQPLADRLGLPIVTDSAFAEPSDLEEVPARTKIAAARLAEVRARGPAAICSQGKLIPPLLAHLANAEGPALYKTPKGGAWVLTWSDDRLLGLSRL